MNKKFNIFIYKERIISVIIFMLSLTDLYAYNIIAPNGDAQLLVRKNNFEFLFECIGKQTLLDILKDNGETPDIRLIYNLDGELEKILLNGYLTRAMCFNSSEWEKIYNYFSELPPTEIPNQQSKLWDNERRKWISRDTLENNYYEEIINSGHYFDFISSLKKDASVEELINSRDFVLKNIRELLYKHLSINNQDPLFKTNPWVELKRKIQIKGNIGSNINNNKNKERNPNNLMNYSASNYYWEKIPINNLNVNIQVPNNSKTKISRDSLSAFILLPNDYYISIQYTKNKPETKLYLGETNFRKRLVDKLIVDKNKIISWGNFTQFGEEYYWLRYRFRYGVTITLYGKNESMIENYQDLIFNTITIVRRPSFNGVYLN